MLLILAGITISLVLGDNGIVGRAKTAREVYVNEQDNEQTQLNEAAAFLNEHVEGEISTPTTPTSYTKYILGQEVTVGGEQFFVIEENDTTSKDTITLITKYNLDPASNTQLNASYSSTAMPFCTGKDPQDKGYWSSISGITYPYELNGVESERATAYNKAVAYGSAKGGTGRLLTKIEAETLIASDKITDIICGKNYTINPVTENNYLEFWLSTVEDHHIVYTMSGRYGYVNRSTFDYSYIQGVRPVITISKSLVS